LRLETPCGEEEIVRLLERRSNTFDLFEEIANRYAFVLAKSQSLCGQRNQCHLRALRALFGLLAFFEATAPRIRKSSADFPPLIAAVNHFGLNPRPAQVSSGLPAHHGSTQRQLRGGLRVGRLLSSTRSGYARTK
jgi:hypothetical protein